MTHLDDQIRATLDEKGEGAPFVPDLRPAVRKRLRQRRNRRAVAVGAAAAGALVAAVAWGGPSLGAIGPAPAPPAAPTVVATTTATPTLPKPPRLPRSTAPLPTRTRQPETQMMPYRSADGGALVTTFGRVPVDAATGVLMMHEVRDSLYYEQGGGLFRRFQDGRLKELGQAGSWIAFSPDDTRYAYWVGVAFGSGRATLRIARTSDDETLAAYDLEYRDPPRLRWTATGLYLLDDGGDAAGYHTLLTAHRVDIDQADLTSVWAPVGTTVLAPERGEAVLVTDHPRAGWTRVRRWLPGTDEAALGEGRTLPAPYLAVTPDGRKLVGDRRVFDATTFEQIGTIDLRTEGRSAPAALDDEFAYAPNFTHPGRDTTPAVVCRLTGQDDCFIDPTGMPR